MAQKLKKTQPNDLRAINEALVLGSVRQHELAEASESLSKQLYALNIQLHTEIDERKRIEAALLESEAYNKSVFEANPDCVKIIDLGGHIERMNANGQCLMEIDDFEALAGAHWPSLWPPELQSEIEAAIATAKTGRTGHFSGFCPTAKGTPKWWDVIVTAVPGKDLSPVRLVASSRDVTDRRQAEATLQGSEERFRALFELGPIGVYSCDAAGMIQAFNKRAADMWGRQPTLGDPAERFCGSIQLFGPSGSFMPHEQCPMAQVVSGKIPEVHDAEVIIKRPDGSQITVIVNIRPLRNELGGIIGAINCFYDITARKNSEEVALHLAAIVETSNDAIISNTLDGMITSWNHGAERLFGYAAQEAIGKPITMLMLPDKHAEERDIIGRIERGERMENYETIRRRKDGSTVWVSLTASPLKDGRGKIIGASKIARDMTGRRRADEHRAILVAELNHRAKNSLAMVQAIASQTLSNAPSLGEAKLAFESRLGALARGHDLLTFGNWAGTDLGSVIKMAVEPHGGGENRFHIEGPVVQLTPATALTFTMAIHELCTNAAKYGALSRQSGNVAIMWQVTGQDEGNRLKLSWTEKGGPAVSPPTRKGFGSRLIERALAMELGGEVRIHYEPSGVVCKIDVPLPKVEAKAGFNAGT